MRLEILDREDHGNALVVGSKVRIIEPTEFQYLTSYAAPISGGSSVVLPKDSILEVTSLPRVMLLRGGRELRFINYVNFEFTSPNDEERFIDKTPEMLETAKKEMKQLYTGYSLFLAPDTGSNISIRPPK